MALNRERKRWLVLCVLLAGWGFVAGRLWPMVRWGNGLDGRASQPLALSLWEMTAHMAGHTSWFGVPARKFPLDFWTYQEILYESPPDVIVEIGTLHGGGALAYAHLCDLLGKGRVISIDISLSRVCEKVREHPRITLIESDACAAFPQVRDMIKADERVMVIEDSSHTYENTLNVLRTYSPLVQPGDYFIVEDGIHYHGVNHGPKPGPYEATQTFLAENKHFIADREREGFGITWNPGGYLRRTEEAR